MELRHLRYFKAVAELEHFHKAADKLCITQSALSNQIKQLERELDTKLFARVGRNVKLTETGSALLLTANKMLNEEEYIKELIVEIEHGQQGQLKIGVLQSVNALYLHRLIIEFDKRYPNLSLQIEELPNTEIENKLRQGDIDIGIGFLLNKEYPQFDTELLFQENWKLLLSSEHAKWSSSILNGKQHPLKAVLFPENFQTRKITESYIHDNNIEVNNKVQVNSITHALDLVKYSATFTILPEAFSILKGKHNIQTFDLVPPLPARRVGLLINKNKIRKRSVEQFAKLIREQLINEN